MDVGRQPYLGRSGYLWAYMRRRRYYMVIAGALIILTAVLIVISASLEHSFKNLSLNVAADLIGTVMVLFLIAPFLERAQLRQDSVDDRFHHNQFMTLTADSRRQVQILELWTDLLEGAFQGPFLDAVQQALTQKVEVRILLLDPDASAAEQRADDLRQRTNVVDHILANLRCLQEFVSNLPDPLRHNIEIRVYSALPPVQMYQADDHVVVSFYPVDTTSWNAVQYRTSPQAQLGTFVGNKFDELWEADSTRTLEQFWEMTLGVGEGSYRVPFVTSEDEIYVSGREIVDGHVASGVAALPVRVVDGGFNDKREAARSYRFVTVEAGSAPYALVEPLFDRKYGQNHHDVILKLVPATEN